MIKKALEYTRVGSKQLAEASGSIVHQKTAIKEFALENGYSIIGSCENFRPGTSVDFKWFDEYFSNAHHQNQYILVSSLDRIGRNMTEVIKLDKYLKEKYGVTIVSVQQPDVDISMWNPNDFDQLEKQWLYN
jgi:DNA invertase Pin-like site-specific DNA recombinase